MQSIYQNSSLIRRNLPARSLVKSIGLGLIGGAVATFIMDLILMILLSAIGMPAMACFTMIGDTVVNLLTLRGALAANSIPLGIAAHYFIGPLFGGLWMAIVAKAGRLHVNSTKRAVLLSILYAEILSQPLLVIVPIVLRMDASDTLFWFGGSFVMHFIWGSILGVWVIWKLRLSVRSKHTMA